MDQDRPTLPDVLSEVAGLMFTLGTVVMAAFPLALPALLFGLLLLPLLLPVLVVALLYGLVALPRRYLAARRARPSSSSVRSRRFVTRSSYS